MAGTTTKGLRYPSAGDNPAIHTDIQNLATDVDTELNDYALLSGATFTGNIQIPTELVFEGATANGFETTLTVVDPTADRLVTFADVAGTVITTGNLTGITAVTSATITSSTITSSTITNGTLGNALAAGTYKITGLGDASESTDTDAVNVKQTLNLARTTMLLLGGM
jgi:hypothetical protein